MRLIDRIIAYVKAEAAARRRYDGQPRGREEVLTEEIERLRARLARISGDIECAEFAGHARCREIAFMALSDS
jgi:hypothetical protein